MSPPGGVSIVIPTLGRTSLDPLVRRLEEQRDGVGVPVELLVVPDPWRAGPARARNRGWAAARYDWVAFLDDDVLPAPDWLAALLRDLDQPPEVGGVQGVLSVPRSVRPDDWEHSTAGLARAAWATADMAYRRAALASVCGFDERFPRAYREDADLAYRVRRHGWRLVVGGRRTVHPVRPEGRWVSLAAQRGNADDALLRRLHGPDWHERLAAPAGRRHRHAAIVAAGLAAAGLAAAHLAAARLSSAGLGAAGPPAGSRAGSSSRAGSGRAAESRSGGGRVGSGRAGAGRRAARAGAVLAGAAWLAGTAEFAAARVRDAPGSDPLALLLTSALIPPLAVGHWLRGWARHRGAPPWPCVTAPPQGADPPGAARTQEATEEPEAAGGPGGDALPGAAAPPEAPAPPGAVPAGPADRALAVAALTEGASAASPSSSPSRSVYRDSTRETASHVRISAARPVWRSVRRGAVG